MIIYGSKSSHVNSALLGDATCPHCETTGQMVMSVFSNYAHVFWIPLFPLTKKVVATCNHCKAFYELKDMPPEIKDQCYTYKKAQKKPLWQFLGLAGIAFLIVMGIINSEIESKKTDTFLENPMLNDVYTVKYEKNYSTMKIVEIADETIFFSENNYYVSQLSKISEIEKAENYDTDDLLDFTLDELKELKKDKTIIKIKRGK